MQTRKRSPTEQNGAASPTKLAKKRPTLSVVGKTNKSTKDRDANDFEEARKWFDSLQNSISINNQATITAAIPSPPTVPNAAVYKEATIAKIEPLQKQVMSVEALEQKKMLLPYLDKIEYINYQLRQRGLLPAEDQEIELIRQEEAHMPRSKFAIKSVSNVLTSKTSASLKKQFVSLPFPHNQEDQASDNPKLSTTILRARYPRLCETIDGIMSLTPRRRQINWVLRLVEEIYDASSELLLPASDLKTDSDPQISPRPEMITVENKCRKRGSIPKPDLKKLALPLFTRQIIHQSVGLASLANQDCLDLVYNLELRREQFPQLVLFASFLRELFDEDALLYFLFVRQTLQQELDLRLKAKEKQVYASNGSASKKYISGNMCDFVNHPLIPDGTKQVLLSQQGAERVLQKVFACSINFRPQQRVNSEARSRALASYVVNEKMRDFFGTSDPLRVSVEEFLAFQVQSFRDVSEDIVAQFKYNDDGESLTTLVRLRDTITSDSKVEKLLTIYGDHERALRNMKIELMKMERDNSNNQYRTQLCLLQNRICLQEQNLKHIQGEITSTEKHVNEVWKEVLGASSTSAGTRKTASNSPLAQKQPSSLASSELISVLGRYECHISRLQRKHELEVKASAILAKSWREQMEDLRVRMVIRIQRAYRERKHVREVKQEARDKLHHEIREREIKNRNDAIERKRMEALREKDMQRHQARLQSKRKQEEQHRMAMDMKQKEIIRKLHEEEAAQRCAERNQKLLNSTFQQWKIFITLRRQKMKASKMFIKFKFFKWKLHYATFKECERAAKRIQRFFRWLKTRQELYRTLRIREKRSKLAKKYLQKVERRQIVMIFNQWGAFTLRQQHLRANFISIAHKRAEFWFHEWIDFIDRWKKKKLDAVMLTQRQYRGRISRQVFYYQRQRNRKALIIQRVYRGYRSRMGTKLMRQLRNYQTAECTKLLQRIKNRQLYICFFMLQLYSEWQKGVRRIQTKHKDTLQQHMIDGWKAFICQRKEKRATLARLQYNSAVIIQRNYRRHRCQQVFRITLKSHRAAITIQRIFRGFLGRQYAKRCWKEKNAALLMQTAWRKRKAKLVAAEVRTETILLAAYKGDYSTVKRAISNGFWYVADAEGNGILHMAAARGNKRVLKLCLRSSMDINSTNKHGQTPLHLLLANLPLDGNNDDYGNQSEKIALVGYMIDHGAWHEAADEEGLTPLLLSAALGHSEAVELLLERVANTDARTISGGLNAAQLSVEGNHSSTLQILLASRGFDFGQNGQDTVYLLHACAGRGLIDCLRVLISHIRQWQDTYSPETLDICDQEGYTPLIYAVNNGLVDVVQCLLENGAHPDVKDYFGRSPLHFALACSDPNRGEAMVKLLTMYEADVNVKDTDGDAPLHVSCDHDDRLACTLLLLTSGAVLCSNAVGNHPTHIAARSGAVETLKLLIEYGGDMNLKNYEGKTPLGMARMYGQKAVVNYITQYFAQDVVTEQEPVMQTLNEIATDPGEADDTLGADTTLQPDVRSLENWEKALSNAYWMGSIAEWTQYIDSETEIPFYYRISETPGKPPIYTWDPPIEFDAALGEDWDIVRGPTNSIGNSSTKLLEEENEDNPNYGEHDSGTTIRHGMQYFYHNKVTEELRTEVPPINYSLLQDIVQNSKRHKMLRARIRKVSTTDISASAMEYMRFFHVFAEESAQTRAEIHAAIKIQRHFRARRTRLLVKALLHQTQCAVDLQRAFRGRKARRLAAIKRKKIVAATQIQAVWRGYYTRKQERLVFHAQRMEHLRRRVSALKIQRLFRGYIARKLFFREKVIQILGPKGYFAWEQLRQRSVVIQSYKVWHEMEARNDFPGVYFYCHQVTRACNWEKPKEWLSFDRSAFEERRQLAWWGYTMEMKKAAIVLQRLWRSRIARISFQMIMKAVKLMQTCEQEYMEEPTNLVKMGNYVLYLHTIVHDYERARPLYGRLMRMMAQRGPDLPFILFSYGIFLYVTQEEDVGIVEEMIIRGKAKDPQLTKYKMAFLGFFRQAMVQNPQDSESNLNYAACVQWLYDQYDEATKYYMRAIAANPYKKGSIELFQDMLNRKKQVDRMKKNLSPSSKSPKRRNAEEEDQERMQYDGFELFRQWQAKQAEQEDLQRKRDYEEEAERNNRLQAARKIQARYRRRQAMRTINKLKLEKQMAASIAELAQQKLVYDRVLLAFQQLGSSSKQTKNKSPPLSIGIVQLENLFRVMNLSLNDVELQTTASMFRTEHPGLKYVNVMDICHFTQYNPLLQAKITAATAASSTKRS